jgi:PAS domain S-box-containing protein
MTPSSRLTDPMRRALLESSLDSVILMDAEGRIVDFNRGTSETFGVNREETIGRLVAEVFLPPELRGGHAAGLARYLATGETRMLGTRIEVPALHASGHRIPVELSVVRLTGIDPPLFVGHLHTIDARLRSDRRLEISAAIHAVFARAVDVDAAVRNTLNALGETLGCLTVQFWSPNEAGSALELRASWEQSPVTMDLSMLRATATLESGVELPGTVLATAQPLWIENLETAPAGPRLAAIKAISARSAIGLPIDVRGRVVGVIEAFWIVQQSADEELLSLLAALGSQLGHLIEETAVRGELARSEARYGQVLASIQDAFTVLDDDYRYLYANERAGQWARCAPSEMVGKFIWDVYPSIRSTPLFDAIRRSRVDRRPITLETLHTDLDLWIEARIYPHPEGTAVFIADISARRHAELERADLLAREQEANRVKDEFLAVVSHELRTPLSPILGWTRMLRQNLLPPEQMRQALDSIERNALLQSHLVEDLLDVSRIVAGKLVITPRPTDAAAAIRAAIDTVRGQADEKQQQLSLDTPLTLPEVFVDPERLQQILTNVLSNAIKFTPEAGLISIDAAAAGDQLEIVVRDTGMGISPGFLPFVFDRFRQADSIETRNSGGLGLGLTIVRDLLAAHGGGIVVTSAGEDRGTAVTIRLPLYQMSPTVNPSGKGS